MRNVVACAALAAMAVSGCQSGGRYGTVTASGGATAPYEPRACTELMDRSGTESRPSSKKDPESRYDWLTLGSTSASRALVARMLRDMSASNPVSEARANLAVRCLSALYGLRVQRQQIWMDSGARVSFLAALGSALTKGTTQNSWAGIAIFPAMLGQAEAFHPTRSLFSSAEASLEALVARYAMAQDVLDQTASISNQLGSAMNSTQCKRAATGPDINMSVLLEPAVAELQAAEAAMLRDCHQAYGQLIAANAVLRIVRERPAIAKKAAVPRREGEDIVHETPARTSGNVLLIRRLLCDALFIDTQVVQRDQQMRTTPEMAAGRLLTSPLRALDSIFTKSDAISPERLRATLALEDFEVRYTGLPELKSIADSFVAEESNPLTQRIAALKRSTSQAPSNDSLDGMDASTRQLVSQAQAQDASNRELLKALEQVQSRRSAFMDQVATAQAAIAGLNAAFAHFGNLATPTGVRFKYNVGEQRFNLEPLPQEPTATVSLMQTHCR